MKSRRFLSLIGLVVAINMVLFLTTALGEGEKPHWTYEGEEGPDHWGDLSEEYALCEEGRAQSPIDIGEPNELNLQDISFSYNPSAMNIFNNGHTIEVEYDAGSTITYNETTYTLAQFHFHHPSEHTVDGVPAAMEIHFVHKDAKDNLAVVGVLLTEGEADNEAYAAIFNALPTEAGEPEPTEVMINAADLLPAARTFYTYTGSLTTPPCSQGVRWLLLTDPIELSAAQIEAFGAIFELNARPVQPLNNRDLLQDNG